jgi:DNA (cytosine-5)-methyltransferase 1
VTIANMGSVDHRLPTVVDLFAGIGGLSAGLEQAGYAVLAAVERDRELAEFYRLNHGRHRPAPLVLNRDVRSLKPKELLEACNLEPGELTLLAGGPPCQGFSTIGKRRKDDDRNELILTFPRYLGVLRSEAFLIENVPGLLGFDGGRVLDRLMTALVGAGYQNATFALVDAASSGVPQKRARVIVYGTRTGPLPDLVDISDPPNTATSAWEAIADLPEPLAIRDTYAVGSAAPYSRQPVSKYARLLRGRARRVTRWEAPEHSNAIVQAYDALRAGETDARTRCWRIDPVRPSRTLRAGSRTRTACRPVHPFQPRVITVREAARLHSFPDWYQFPPSTSYAHVAIGNAVPPRMAEALALRFLSTTPFCVDS